MEPVKSYFDWSHSWCLSYGSWSVIEPHMKTLILMQEYQNQERRKEHPKPDNDTSWNNSLSNKKQKEAQDK